MGQHSSGSSIRSYKLLAISNHPKSVVCTFTYSLTPGTFTNPIFSKTFFSSKNASLTSSDCLKKAFEHSTSPWMVSFPSPSRVARTYPRWSKHSKKYCLEVPSPTPLASSKSFLAGIFLAFDFVSCPSRWFAFPMANDRATRRSLTNAIR